MSAASACAAEPRRTEQADEVGADDRHPGAVRRKGVAEELRQGDQLQHEDDARPEDALDVWSVSLASMLCHRQITHVRWCSKLKSR